MFSFLPLALILLFSLLHVNALVVPRKAPPPGWATDYLEPYDRYHTRYLALGCHNKHNDSFFDLCCHPLLATESLQTARDPQCIPSPQASASASMAEPTSTVKTPADEDDADCEDDDANASDDQDCESDDESDAPSASNPPPAPSQPSPPPPKAAPAAPAAKPPTPAPAPPAPKPSPSNPPAPKPASSKPKPAAAAPAKSDGLISGIIGDLIGGGFATFFYQNGVAGACGKKHSDSDFVAAMDYRRYGNTGLKSALCGKQVKVTNTKNQKSVTVTVADACPTCENSNSIDLSKSAFLAIATESEGMVPIEWAFID